MPRASAAFNIHEHARQFAPQYGEQGYADHLPMAATALRALGANDDRIDAFAQGYRKRLKRKKIGKKSIDALLLSARIGDPTVYAPALNFFDEAIKRDGRSQVLGEYLPELTNAIATGAFHGVIRTAFGLIAESDSEIAAGLAYWWAHAETMSFGFARSIGAANNNAETLLEDMARATAKHRNKLKVDQPTISERISAVIATPGVNAVLNRAAAANVSFDQIAVTALQMFLAEEDLTALHCVTGVHATRILADHVVMDDAALRKSLWASLLAAYGAMGAPDLPALNPAPSGAPDWHVISSAAQSSDDEHDIKFAYAVAEESRHYGRDTHYRYAAASRLGLLKR